MPLPRQECFVLLTDEQEKQIIKTMNAAREKIIAQREEIARYKEQIAELREALDERT